VLDPPADKPHIAISDPYNVTIPGKIFNMQAHVHDGGISVGLKLNGKQVCTSKAIYGGDKGTASLDGAKWETIQAYEPCPKAIDLKVGDQLLVDALYDLKAHRL
jgi:hypothetical protein